MDVERELAPQIASNKTLSKELAVKRAFLAAKLVDGKKEAQEMEAAVASCRQEHEKACEPIIAKYDQIAIGKVAFDELEHSFHSIDEELADALAHELETYGFRSKMLCSFSVTLEALKSRLAEGGAFEKELASLRAELLDPAEFDTLCTAFEPLAKCGFEGEEVLAGAAFEFASQLSATFEVPKGTGWFAALKLREQRSEPVDVQRLTTRFLERVGFRDMGGALGAADEAMRDLRDSGISSEQLSTAHRRFQQCVLPRVAAEQFVSYYSALLAVQRYALVEHIVTPITKKTS